MPRVHAPSADVNVAASSRRRAAPAPVELALLRQIGHQAGNRALTRRLLQREPKVDARPLELQVRYDAATRTLRKSEMTRVDAGDEARGRGPSLEEVYWVEFKVSPEGVMTVSARTVATGGAARSPSLRLGTEFGAALKEFKTKGIDVKAFDADWSHMSDTEPSTNLETFETHLRENPKGGREQAARATPSGKVAVREGFTDVTVGATKQEADPDIGAGTYPRVRVRFARPGVGPLPGAPSGEEVKGGAGSTPPTSTSGAGSAGGSTTKTSTRVGAGAMLAVMGANIALNWGIEWANERRIKAALAKLEPSMTAERDTDPTMGFLLVFRYSGGVQTPDGPSAAARFEGLSYVRGYTESEAKSLQQGRANMGADDRFGYAWIAPAVAPDPLLLTTPFPQAGVAKFADVSRIQFRNVKFANWGGFGSKGSTRRLDGSSWSETAGALRMLVLEMPSEIPMYDVNRRRTTKSIDVGRSSVKGGQVPALMLDDDDPVVAVWPATDKTVDLFGHTQPVDDKDGRLSLITNMDAVRWVDPDVIELVKTVSQEAKPS